MGIGFDINETLKNPHLAKIRDISYLLAGPKETVHMLIPFPLV